ncbi:hypothetical protein ACGF5M_03090 [Gemmatimonadota bacterium]
MGGVGKWFKKQIKSIGKVAKKAAPIVGLIPGVGTVAAAGLGGLGGALSGEGWRGALQGAAGGAAGSLGKYGLSKVGSSFGSGGQDQGWLSKVGGFLGDNSDLIMGGINAYGNAKDQGRRDDYMNEAMGFAREDRARNQALYDRISGLDPNAGRENLDATFADESNPFYRAPSRPQITGLGIGGSDQPGGLAGRLGLGPLRPGSGGGTLMSKLRSGELSLPEGTPVHTGSGGFLSRGLAGARDRLSEAGSPFGEGGPASGLGSPTHTGEARGDSFFGRGLRRMDEARERREELTGGRPGILGLAHAMNQGEDAPPPPLGTYRPTPWIFPAWGNNGAAQIARRAHADWTPAEARGRRGRAVRRVMDAARWFGLHIDSGTIWLRFLTLCLGLGWRFGGRPVALGITAEAKSEEWADRLIVNVALWPISFSVTLDRLEDWNGGYPEVEQ